MLFVISFWPIIRERMFYTLLKNRQAQASCSQQGKIPSGMGANLFQELSGLLQRYLYQQAKVKEVMYYGMVKLVLVDPSIAGSISDFLLPHSLQFHNEISGTSQNHSLSSPTDDPLRTLFCWDVGILGAPVLTIIMLLLSRFKSSHDNGKSKQVI